MNDTKTEKTEFDAIDEAIAKALADDSAWPRPDAGFAARCEGRIARILAEKSAAGKGARRRASFFPAWGGLAMRAAAAVLVVLGLAYMALSRHSPGEPGGQQAVVASVQQDFYEEVDEIYVAAPLDVTARPGRPMSRTDKILAVMRNAAEKSAIGKAAGPLYAACTRMAHGK